MARDSQGRAGAHFAASRPPRSERRPRQRGAGAPAARVSSRTASVTGGVRARGRGAVRDRRARPSRAALALVALAIVLVVGGAVLLVGHLVAPADEASQTESGTYVTIQIPEGSGADVVASKLLDAGVISSTEEFYKELSRQSAESSIKSGTYSFMTGANLEEVVRQLKEGPNTTESQLTVAEGLTVEKTAAAVESALGVPADDFLAQAKASNYKADYAFLADAQDDSLEGFLCPKTYDFSGKEVTADSVIRAMLDQFQAELSSMDLSSGESRVKSSYGVTMSDYDIVTLASVIEREAVTDDDRLKVASVFYNRLKAGMALQSDATMGYVTGEEVTASDLKTESPYNTYLNKGLPPTPICTPSVESIEAALEPADTDCYYFLIIENGSYSNHTFSMTYEEHEAAIAKAQSDQS